MTMTSPRGTLSAYLARAEVREARAVLIDAEALLYAVQSTYARSGAEWLAVLVSARTADAEAARVALAAAEARLAGVL